MLKYEKKEIGMEIALKKRIEFVCDFLRLKPVFINGNVISIERTNIRYIEVHRIIIKGITFLAFNYSSDLFIQNLNKHIELKDLLQYLKSI